jgi:ABC-2 type transport system ATP-binding protein
MEKVIAIQDLEKVYPKNAIALKKISLSINNGEILGLIGPNGAGKTTLVRIILGLLTATSGRVTIWDSNARDLSFDLRRQIGFFPTDQGIYEELTAEENIRFWAKALNVGKEEIEKIMKKLELWKIKKRLVKKLSSGMKQRLAFACAIFHGPKLLIMDEPTANLDVYSKSLLLDFIKTFREGKTTIITSHNLYDLEKVCTRIVILHHGDIIEDGTIEELKKRFSGNKVLVTTSSSILGLKLKKKYKMKKINDKQILFSLDSENPSDLVKYLVINGVNVENVVQERLSLEEVYLKLTKEEEK